MAYLKENEYNKEEEGFGYDYNEEEAVENEEWWNNLSEEEQDEYERYWENESKRIDEMDKNKPPRPKTLSFEDIEILEEMLSDEREEWLNQKYAYALELISIADFLDKKGSFEVVNYIDNLIKK